MGKEQDVRIESHFGGQDPGREVITASSATEYTFEGDQLADSGEPAPSVFTTALIEGLKTGDADLDQDGFVTVDDLYQYIYHEAAASRQWPTRLTSGMGRDLIIARRARPPAPAPLPADLQDAIRSPVPGVRAAAVAELARLLQGTHLGLALSAQLALEQLTKDDSRTVAMAATAALRTQLQPPKPQRLDAAAAITGTEAAPSGSGADQPGQQTASREALPTLGLEIPGAPAHAASAEGSGQASGAGAIAQSSIQDMAEVQNGRDGLAQDASGPPLTAQPPETQVQASRLHRQRIFLCYRREDALGFARGIYESLASKYGHEQIFRDIDSTPPGIRYSAWIESRVGQCTVMIVLIGNGWLSAKDDAGRRRLDLDKDWVRQEIEAALRRDIPIIPVRLQGAPMPSEDELPPSIADLASFQSAEVADSRWAFDLGMLIEAIDNLVAPD